MRRLFSIVVVVFATSACGGNPASPSPGSGASPVGSWVLQAGSGPDGPIPLVDGYRITLRISGRSIGGTSACNSYGGTIAFAGSAVRISDLMGTLKGCAPEVMDSEAAFTAALVTVVGWSRDGDILTLGGPRAELTFALLQPVAVEDFVDTAWVLDTLIRGAATSPAEGEATLELRPDGSLVGSTGCRILTGTYVINADEVGLTRFMADGDCPAELQAQDGHVVTVLGDGFTAEVADGRLTLTSTGNLGLSYLPN